jgi:ribosome-binding protein aMBF1 (putative translation factor)
MAKQQEDSMDKLGKIVRAQREAKKESTKQLAKVLKCKESFVKHIEHSKCVSISERIEKGLRFHFRSMKEEISKAVKSRNKTATY